MIKKTILLMLLFVTTLTLSACHPFDIVLGLDIDSVTLDESTLKDVYFLDDFDLSSIELIVINDDGTEERVGLRLSMFSWDDREKFTRAGRHSVTARYRGFDIPFEIQISTQTTLEVVFL